MKKLVLLLAGSALFTGLVFAQTNVTLINPGFETPDDSIKIKCDDTAFTSVEGFGWRVDNCSDVGREEAKKFGGESAGDNKQAYEGWHVAFSHNLSGHVYQIVEEVPATPTTYHLSSQAIWSWTDVWTCYPTNYISLFSGTDTINRVIVAGDSVLIDSLTLVDYEADYTNVEWDELSVTYITTEADAGKHLCIEFGNSAAAGSSWTYFYHDAFELTKTTGTGIGNINIVQTKVYPNPSDGIFKLVSGINSVVNFNVYNTSGQKIKSGAFRNSYDLDLSNYSKGLYILYVNSGNNIEVSKLILK